MAFEMLLGRMYMPWFSTVNSGQVLLRCESVIVPERIIGKRKVYETNFGRPAHLLCSSLQDGVGVERRLTAEMRCGVADPRTTEYRRQLTQSVALQRGVAGL